MQKEIATYILKNDKNETLAEFESSIPASILQDYLKENQNRFCKETFIKFVNTFLKVTKKFTIL